MIAPVCDRCGKELMVPGGLIFSPPDESGRVVKQHVCVDCWPPLEARYEQVGWVGDGQVFYDSEGKPSEGRLSIYRKVERPMEGTTR